MKELADTKVLNLSSSDADDTGGKL